MMFLERLYRMNWFKKLILLILLKSLKKIEEIEEKLSVHDRYITNPEFNNVSAQNLMRE